MARPLADQRTILVRLGAGYALWAAVIVTLLTADVEVLDLFRDPSEIGGRLPDHPWKSGFSTAGIFAWAAGAAVCLFAGAVAGRAGRGERRTFLLATGGLVLLLGLDDAYVVHESLAELATGFDAAEPFVMAGLATAIAVWAVTFRRSILRSDWMVLVLAGTGLGGASALDRIGGSGILEESVEFPGLITLVVYAASESWREVAGDDRGSSRREPASRG